MTEKKQISNVTVPERRGRTSTCKEYLTISNFEELFEYSGYNLSTLTILHLSKLTELRVIWSGLIQVEYFQNLAHLTVKDCRRLRYIFSPTIARNLPHLGKLDISNCEELEQIIEKDQTPSQHHLQPICFPILSWITIEMCENLKCLFPITLAHGGLPNLEQLDLIRLSKLEQVFEGDESNVSKDEEKVIHLPELTDLVLDNLPNLVSFSPVDYHFVFPSLTDLRVEGCPNVTTRFSFDSKESVHAKTQIERCSKLQDIIQGPEVLISMSQGLARLNKVELINLPQLKGKDRNDIVLTSPSLYSLTMRDCPQLTPFIVSTNIQELKFSKMTEKKQISNVTVPERREGTSACTEYLTISNFEELFEYSGYNLSTLKFLRLSKLTELGVIWSGPIQVEHFQNLCTLTVKDCRRLRYIFSSTIARNLPQLCSLDISDCEELEQIIEKDQTPSQHHLQPNCFPKLSWITIRNCENLKSLFPLTLAHGGVPNLGGLYLERVTKLEQVFEGDESNVSKDEEKVIHLPELTDLVLDNLPNLVSFSPVGYHFIFQILRYLKVEGCPNVTTRFSVDSKESVHAKTQVWNKRVYGNIFVRKRKLVSKLEQGQRVLDLRPSLRLGVRELEVRHVTSPT
ncbi:Disease resistance RPS2 -like protein [Gossypium arboreum]|uniref:Disease resistance RPS2-like protein n=1 Tax=Gossypium arboreum TaxID=29729 RepID=A0A0B0MTN2_GOSAR|nr:Disease resistance RPS2 -like protein [Gossypium arboreum]